MVDQQAAAEMGRKPGRRDQGLAAHFCQELGDLIEEPFQAITIIDSLWDRQITGGILSTWICQGDPSGNRGFSISLEE